MKEMTRKLNEHCDLNTLREIDQNFYMIKQAELITLAERLDEITTQLLRLHHMLQVDYKESFYRWKKEYIWLHRYIRSAHQKKCIL